MRNCFMAIIALREGISTRFSIAQQQFRVMFTQQVVVKQWFA